MTELFPPNGNEFFALPFFLLLWIIDILAIIRRLHDLNRSGRQYGLLMVPIYNIYLALILWFKRGTRGPNRYGPDPLEVNILSQQTLAQSELNRPIG
jgi:uncharacterized membrane protein YhaH (DUF805 family)